MTDDEIQRSRFDILDLMDSFISKILELRRILLGVSLSGFILAPFAIGLSVFLLTHKNFVIVLDNEYDFGVALSILLGLIIAISVGWMITGIRQYKTLKSWNRKYNEYLQQKDEIDKKIASQYGLDPD
ncbi:hypothetical protein [Candidatus Nitrosotalea okcheonensis]|uniref:Uncharacterized protein n=1 Tax=Candidatus Nitrosotalea okcheonensis TaxID=1903276 RepID=A0A2H1FE99_9ARCH|nr:hypothetical protein [Candidatus Nitrosotalea okcheonensis]MDE1727662.1 hypothetical protein [Nitrososphaerota archaeon]MDE1830761.1 hypothetical protein [Nitrososphaerota archaeon]MDE1840811.1 hypothetical protein [Nitrososphaerota archaeon]MDE1877013.1 hypothetical protein [Nitrososphaerota archaeon]SMH71083.1 conserved protein of unknown function [Candidatus Nitrosotalea okcheonensis]